MLWSAALAMIRAKFPRAVQMETSALAERLSSSPADVLLLDCRAEEEVAVSRLPGAEWAPPGMGREELLGRVQQRQARPDLIVCYCSIGYRSSAHAQTLGDAGLPAVNLQGSIFAWANEGRAMVDGEGRPTAFAHPYNAVWGKFLDADKRKATP